MTSGNKINTLCVNPSHSRVGLILIADFASRANDKNTRFSIYYKLDNCVVRRRSATVQTAEACPLLIIKAILALL